MQKGSARNDTVCCLSGTSKLEPCRGALVMLPKGEVLWMAGDACNGSDSYSTYQRPIQSTAQIRSSEASMDSDGFRPQYNKSIGCMVNLNIADKAGLRTSLA